MRLPRHSGLRRALRGVAWVAGGLLAVAVAAAVLAPILVRGPSFAWLVGRVLPPVGGVVELGGGGLAADAVLAYLRGRPIGLTLERVRIVDPEGVEVFRSARVEAKVIVDRRGWRLIVDELRPGRGTWRFARMQKRNGIGFLAAFQRPARTPPAPAAGRDAGRATQRRGSAEARAGGVTLRRVVFDGLDAEFDFPGWGLVLRDVAATGGLQAGVDAAGPSFGFEVRDVHARGGGRLRVLGGDRAVSLPFAAARLARIGTFSDAPADLVLEVDEARTGTSRLRGKAVFGGLFRLRRGGPAPGMKIDAVWERAADGLGAALSSRFGGKLAITGDDVRVEATLGATFAGRAPASKARLRVDGLGLRYRGMQVEGVRLAARAGGQPAYVVVDELSARRPGEGSLKAIGKLDADGRVEGTVTFADFVTDSALPGYARPLLGGRLDGWIRAEGDLRRRSMALGGLDLRLERTRRGPLPRRVRFRGSAARARRDEAVVLVRGLGVSEGQVQIDRLATDLFGGVVSLRGGVVRRLPGPPRIDLTLDARRVDLARALPEAGVGGVVTVLARARGGADDLTVDLGFHRGSELAVAGGRYELPARVRARVRGDELVLPALRLERIGGGSLEAHGSIVLDRTLMLGVIVRDHPLSVLGAWTRDARLAGSVGGELRLTGAPARPDLQGSLALSRITMAGVPLGDASLTMGANGGDGSGRLEADLFGQARLAGRLDVSGSRALLDATLVGTATNLKLLGQAARGGWAATLDGRLSLDLARPVLRAMRLGATGSVDAKLSARGERGRAVVEGSVSVVEPVRLVAPGWGMPVSLSSGVVALTGDRLDARALTMAVDGARLRVDGHAEVKRGRSPRLGTMDLTLDGEVDAALLARQVRGVVTAARGALRVKGRLVGQPESPRIDGQIELGKVELQVRGEPSPVRISGGRVVVTGRELSLHDIVAVPPHGGTVTIGGGKQPGRITLDRLQPLVLGPMDVPIEGQRIALQLPGLRVDDANFAVRLRGEGGAKAPSLAGTVRLEAGRFSPTRTAPAESRASAGDAPSSPGRTARGGRGSRATTMPIALDLRLISDGERFVIDPGWLPDLHLGLDFRVGGTLARPTLSGDAKARSLYGRVALWLFKLFS